MPADFTVTGGEQLRLLGAQLKIADRRLRLDTLAKIRVAAQPLVKEIRQSAREELPAEGGLAERVSKSRISVRTRLTGRTVGISIRASNPYSIGAMNRGRLRHPVFGNRAVWVNQQVTPGWWDKPTSENPELAMEVQHEIETVLDETDRRLKA